MSLGALVAATVVLTVSGQREPPAPLALLQEDQLSPPSAGWSAEEPAPASALDTEEPLGVEPSAWEKPGCHLLGHSRAVSIPGCAQFSAVTNGCRGFCPSVAFPALRPAAPRPVTSLAQCCSIMESEQITVQVLCLDGEKNVTLRSATSCACYHCHKD